MTVYDGRDVPLLIQNEYKAGGRQFHTSAQNDFLRDRVERYPDVCQSIAAGSRSDANSPRAIWTCASHTLVSVVAAANS